MATNSVKLEGKVAFVTGASSGIGAAVARALAGQGVKLGLASRHTDDLGLANVVTSACDVRERAQIEEAIAATVQRFGRLDIVVANAGIGSYRPVVETSLEEVDEMVDINVKGLIYTAQAAIPHLHDKGGDFITLASEAGRRGLPDEAVYVASKFAQVGFTRSLDHELRSLGIRCSNICPGGVATNFGMGRGLRTPDMPELANMMQAEDVAEVVLFTLTRPPTFRILETAFRSMHEQNWG
ncbi:SDR family oxidoreductase [Rhizobium rosettiformans]|uniref:SDR family oxidoreductase n=1 Tax=Rhizobium rosettiformans TaxID=1368430 RepID=UPI002858F5DD|nr:SDR family NAD(P)-dependent oxidoreductase [Rhizobium rosettiformans]MDR7031163.1 3-oxoacyl-[acyl-carrier protein] reductase [Rhizobium rosettiformans]MDR7066728.1 3-oxoacyl-[acyl-carrier protein] reductase [Rhizobium rosettiformans]